MSPDLARLRRTRRRAVMTAGAAIITAAFAVLYVWQYQTAGDVKVVQRNSRCNGGDLAACRIVAQNLRRACTPRILARVSAKHRARERRRCGALGLRADVRGSTPARARGSTPPTSTSTSHAGTSGRQTSTAPRAHARTPSSRRPAGRPKKPAPPTAAPSSPSPAPAAPAPAQPQPLITLPDGLPCVPVAQLIGC